MGYTTDFNGVLKLNKQLTEEDDNFIRKLTASRRMKLKVESKYGVEGEFYVADDLGNGFRDTKKVLDNNSPPSTQPGLWCHILPTDDGMGLEWDGGEKTYDMEDWIFYLINRYLAPRGYVVNGTMEAFGEDHGDIWAIKVEDNVVRVAHFKRLLDRSEPKWLKTDWEERRIIPMTVKEPKKPKKQKAETTKIEVFVDSDGDKFISQKDLVAFLENSEKNFKGARMPAEVTALLQLFKQKVKEL
jgi:hypothetical protein